MYWLCPSGLLLREVRPEPDDWLLAVPRLAELVREVVVRDDFSADLLCPDCGWPVVLLLDSFMTFKELSETLMLSKGRSHAVESQPIPHLPAGMYGIADNTK